MASYSSYSSEDLVKACVRSKSEAAWIEFVRRYRPVIAKVVLRTARRWTLPHPHLLDDLIQETFVRLCADDCAVLKRFHPVHRDSIFGYLKSVAASVVCDHFKFERARKRDVTQTDAISDHITRKLRSSWRADPDALESRIILQEIDEAIHKLFRGENFVRNRTIFWLHNREGMTASAIASIPWIGLNTKGVESTLRRMTDVIQSHIGSIQ